MGKRKRRECAYCGNITEVTQEHVIPKCLFTRPYPPNLITVSVCEPCNHAKSHNDDFLRDWLTMDIFGSQSPDAQAVFADTVVRSTHEGHSKLAKQLLSEAQLEPFTTKAGIYLGDLPAITLDEERVNQIFTTIVRGLYYHKNKARMPDGLNFILREQYPWDHKSVFEIFSNLRAQPWRALGNVFGYTYTLWEQPVFVSIWLLLFYGRVMFTISAIDSEAEKYRHQRGRALVVSNHI
jgi:hypothetical protein